MACLGEWNSQTTDAPRRHVAGPAVNASFCAPSLPSAARSGSRHIPEGRTFSLREMWCQHKWGVDVDYFLCGTLQIACVHSRDYGGRRCALAGVTWASPAPLFPGWTSVFTPGVSLLEEGVEGKQYFLRFASLCWFSIEGIWLKVEVSIIINGSVCRGHVLCSAPALKSHLDCEWLWKK